MITPLLGRPSIGSESLVSHRVVSRQGFWTFLAAGVTVDGAKSRDPGNTDTILTLRPGLLMGKVTSTGQYAPSVIGVTSGALANGGTTLSMSAAAATEIVRRIGSSGTITLTGPPTANGTVRTSNVSYSAANVTVGNLTITSPSTNEVQTANFTGSPAGYFTLAFTFPGNGLVQQTAPILYNGTAANLVANITTALDSALGANQVIASGSAVTAIALTFSGNLFANQPVALATVGDGNLTAGAVSIVETTSGASGAFVAGSFIGDTDGSQIPVSVIPDGYGILVPSNSADVDWPLVPIGGVIDSAQILPAWPSDTSLRTWIRTYLSTVSGGKFTFSDQF